MKIEFKNVTHEYNQKTTYSQHGISNVSLSLETGKIYAVIGPTGSGKSTFIQHFNALLQPTSGAVLLDGKDINENKKTQRNSRFKIGLCFQYPENQLFAETIREDIAFGPQNQGLKNEAIDERVNTTTERVGLDSELLEKSPFDLSGGEKRRVALAGVIAMQPQILVLDEPAAGLDPKGKQRLRETITRYREETNCTVVIVSHAMEEIAALCDRVLVLDHGKSAMLGTVDEIFTLGDRLTELGLELPEILQIHELLINK